LVTLLFVGYRFIQLYFILHALRSVGDAAKWAKYIL